MIAKVTRGASGRGLIRYLFGPGRANEHADQRVITSGLALGGEALAGRGLSKQEIADLGASLDAARDAYGSDPKGGHLYHLSLSLPPGEKELTDEQWADIAVRSMHALGFEKEGVEPAAWAAVGHGVSANGNQHIHIAASLVRLDGSRVNIWQDRKTLSRVCAEVETVYGLTAVEGREGAGMPGLSRTELERSTREHLAEPERVTLARIVRAASAVSKDELEFIRGLRENGVLVRPRFESGGRDTVVGYSVALGKKLGDVPVWFGGGKLARDLTLPSLRQLWEASSVGQRDAVAEWTAVAPRTRTWAAAPVRPEDWYRALADMERSVRKLSSVPASDRLTWQGVAREAAGVFAAASRRFERDSPGPMSVTADALARSAQGHQPIVAMSRTPSRFLRGIAAVVVQSDLSSDSVTAWAVLLGHMGRTLRAIADAHFARGESNMAEMLVDRLSVELDVTHDKLGTVVPQSQIAQWPSAEGAVGVPGTSQIDGGEAIDVDLDSDHDRDVAVEL